jgi:hypothetical protein
MGGAFWFRERKFGDCVFFDIAFAARFNTRHDPASITDFGLPLLRLAPG